MFSSTGLDVAIGLCLFFLLISLLCSGVREAGETLLKSRARDLERGLRMLLDDEDGTSLMSAVMGHGLLSSLAIGDYDPINQLKRAIFGRKHLPVGGRSAFPSYIPSRQFAAALLDIVARGSKDWPAAVGVAQITAQSVRDGVTQLPSVKVQRVVLSALDNAGNDLTRARTELEHWFDGSMDRVSGWYKRRTQIVLFLIGFAAAALLNLDAMTVATQLTDSAALRTEVVAQAAKVTATDPQSSLSVDKARSDLSEIGYPIGWQPTDGYLPLPAPQFCPNRHESCTFKGNFKITVAFATFLGWLVTAFAVTLGAPFWFDLLNKFMVIRSTVKPHQKSPEEGSADAQPSGASKPAAGPGAGDARPATNGRDQGDDQKLPFTPPSPPWPTDESEAWRPGFIASNEVAL